MASLQQGKNGGLSLEGAFIADCLRHLVMPKTMGVQPPSFFSDAVAWRRVVALGRAHNISGFIAFVMERSCWRDRLPEDLAEVFQDILQTARFDCAEKKMEFGKICSLFAEENIPLIPLKGVALAHVIYADMPVRSMGDVDVLIHPQDKGRALAALERRGFSPVIFPLKNRWHARITDQVFKTEDLYGERSGRYAYVDPGGVQVDIHTEPVYLVDKTRMGMDWPRVWERAVPWKGLGASVHMLSEQDQLVFTALHAMDRYDPKLIQLLDLALLMQRYPAALQALEREDGSGLSREDKSRILDFCRTVQAGFSSGRLVNDPLVKLFFDRKDRRVEHKGFITSVYGRIKSRREKAKYLLGYFLPDPVFYKRRGLISRYFVHWAGLFVSVIMFLVNKLLRKPWAKGLSW